MRSASKLTAFLTAMNWLVHFPSLGITQAEKGKVERVFACEPSYNTGTTGAMSEATHFANTPGLGSRCTLQIAFPFFLMTALSLWSQPRTVRKITAVPLCGLPMDGLNPYTFEHHRELGREQF